VTNLTVQPLNEKQIRIRGIDPVLLDCLQNLPQILEQRDSPAARQRLLPDLTPADPQANREWQHAVAPELRHLFATAGETVIRDLTAVTPTDPSARHHELTFPAEHVNAWMCALNEARLILGQVFQITEADMATTEFDVRRPKGRAVLRIHVLGYLLQLFVQLETGHGPEASL
jgi:hypothetical protein